MQMMQWFNQGGPERRARRSGILTAAVCAAMTIALDARGQETAREHLEPRVTAAQFTAFIVAIDPSRDERAILNILFEDYDAAVEALSAETESRADAAGRRTVNDAITGKVRLEPAELRRMRLEVLRVYQSAWPAVDALFEKLIGDGLAMLDADHAAAARAAIPALRRAALLHPRAEGSQSYEYAGDGADLTLLLEDAIEGGELAAMAGGGTPEGGESWRSLAKAEAEYALQLDAALRESARDVRQARMDRRMARIENDAVATRAAEERLIEHWRRLHEVNRAFADRVAALAGAALGEEARLRWLARVEEASFPWMFRQERPDQVLQWLSHQEVAPELREAVGQRYAAFVARRRELRSDAIALMVRGRMELRAILFPMMNASTLTEASHRALYEEIVRNSGQQATLARDAAAEIEGLLPVEMRQALKRALPAR
jgi:hypothetical protein